MDLPDQPDDDALSHAAPAAPLDLGELSPTELLMGLPQRSDQ
jgi:hypothetical protein